MRTVVVGNRKLARQVLRHTLDEGWNVVGALVPEGTLATEQANFVPVDELVSDTECALHETTDINDTATRDWLRGIDPDVCLCGGWSQIIGAETLAIPRRGFLGFHASQLPAGRGGAPVNWSIIDGADEVWMSLFYYTPEVDAGDVVAQGSVSVEPRDDVSTVFDALAVEACRLLSEVRPSLETDEIDGDPQPIANATYRPRRQPQDGLVDWDRSSERQRDWIRAQTDPYPGAYTFFDGARLTIWQCAPVEKPVGDAEPGEVVRVENGRGIDVRTGDGAIRLTRVQAGDRPPRWGDDYARDAGIGPGDTFGREGAPTDWYYTGIRGPDRPTEFESNLALGERGRVEVVGFAGSPRDFSISVSVDGRPVFERTVTATREYREQVAYEPTETGTHTLAVEFRTGGETVDTRYLKVFVHE
jgi:methionyl-tRNA formyltransferase